MSVRLEMLSDDPEEQQLAVRYWAMGASGEFLEKVVDLVPFRSITQSGALAGAVRGWCRAYDEYLTCPDCDTCLEVSSRSAVKKHPQPSHLPCPECAQLRSARRLAEQQAAAAALQTQLAAYAEQLPNDPIDYEQLPDDQALLLVALNAALSPRLLREAFTVSDCIALTPWDVRPFIERLEVAGVLREDPLSATPGTYYLRDGQLYVIETYKAYRLAPDVQSGNSDEAWERMIDRSFSDSSALFELWLDFACADCMRYLIDKCRAFDHDLDQTQLKEIRSTLREALKVHSVSQVWFVIWKNVKDAASLARLVYYSAARATATIPGKIRRTLEKTEKEGTLLRKWDRPDQQAAGTLGMVFNEWLKVDEDTPGIEVLERLLDLAPSEPPAYADHMVSAADVRQLLCGALINDTGKELLLQFAGLIRDGLALDQAVSSLLERATPSGG